MPLADFKQKVLLLCWWKDYICRASDWRKGNWDPAISNLNIGQILLQLGALALEQRRDSHTHRLILKLDLFFGIVVLKASYMACTCLQLSHFCHVQFKKCFTIQIREKLPSFVKLVSPFRKPINQHITWGLVLTQSSAAGLLGWMVVV